MKKAILAILLCISLLSTAAMAAPNQVFITREKITVDEVTKTANILGTDIDTLGHSRVNNIIRVGRQNGANGNVYVQGIENGKKFRHSLQWNVRSTTSFEDRGNVVIVKADARQVKNRIASEVPVTLTYTKSSGKLVITAPGTKIITG